MTGDAPVVVIYGAAGTLGDALVERLARVGGPTLVLAGRAGAPLVPRHAELARASVRVQLRVGDRDDPEALAQVCAGARVVIDASSAAMRADRPDPLVSAAIRAGAHYLDARRDASPARALYEQHDRAARRAGVIACGAVGVEAALGDLAASLAAGALGRGGLTRGVRRGVGAEPMPLDRLDLMIAYDDYVASPGDARSLADVGASPALRWEQGRWHPAALGERRRQLWLAGVARPALSWPGAEVVTLPRHVPAERIDTYRALADGGAGAGLATAMARVAGPLARLGLGRRGGVLDQLVVAPVGDAAARARVRFVVCAEAAAGDQRASAFLIGRDPTATTAALLAAACARLCAERSTDGGALALPEWWPTEVALAALEADGVVEVTRPAC
jgi:short subunit dehydrogenase-like uncharacterized protein